MSIRNYEQTSCGLHPPKPQASLTASVLEVVLVCKETHLLPA